MSRTAAGSRLRLRTRAKVDRLEPDFLGVGETLPVHVADQHDRGTQNARGGGRCHADRPRSGDIHGRPDADLGRDRTVKSGRQDVGQASQIADLFERLSLIREFQAVEVGVRHHDVFGLTADPPAQIDITVSAAGALGVDVQADVGMARATGAAAAASDIERNRDEIADAEVFDVAANLDDLAGDLVTQHHAGRRCGSTAHHVLVGDMNRERLAHAKKVGFEPIDLSAHDRLGELVADVLGVPEVDCAIDCVGFEAKAQGSDGQVVDAPAVVLNSLMEVTRPAGSIGIPGLYVTEDPGAKEKAAQRGVLSLRFGLGWAKSHSFHTGQTPVLQYNRQLMQAILWDRLPIGEVVNVKVISLDQAPEGYRNFDAGVPNKFVIDPHGLVTKAA